MNIINRIKAPTPVFFKKLRTASLVLAGLAGTIATAPIAIPAIIIKVAGYLAVAGSVGAGVCQAVTTGDEQPAEVGNNGK